MTIQDLAHLMYELFKGRLNAYAVRSFNAEGAKVYFPARDEQGEDLPFTPEVCEQHLKGEISIGVYPINDKNEVHWAVFDFDNKEKGNAFTDAQNLKAALASSLGLMSYIERSQSGNGIHLWVFFAEAVPALVIRTILLPFIPDVGKKVEERATSIDRLFPHQNTVVNGYGNLCALPLNGPENVLEKHTTVFLNDLGEPFEDQKAVLKEVHTNRNSIHTIVEAFQSVPTDQQPVSPGVRTLEDRLQGGAKVISDYGCKWLNSVYKRSATISEPEWYDALCELTQLEAGRILAHKISKDYPKYSAQATDRKFDYAIRANKPLRVETVHERYGECPGGCICTKLGLKFPYEIAKIPMHILTQEQGTKVWSAVDLSRSALHSATEIHSGKRMGFPWGYDVLDDATELRPSDLVIVAARRSIGKTAFALDSSTLGATNDIPQYFVSLEMSAEQLALRYLANISDVDHTLITTGRMGKAEWDLVNSASRVFEKLPLFVDDRMTDTEKMLDTLGELIVMHGPGPVWIDYLQLVRKKTGESKKEAVDRAIDAYKSIAKILKVPVIALAQLNRQEETYEGDDDLDSWLKDSGDIEQTADVILYIRGKRGPGTVTRNIKIHKERHREAHVGFRFDFRQGVYKFNPWGKWVPQEEDNNVLEFESEDE
jgi:hypothetical protein